MRRFVTFAAVLLAPLAVQAKWLEASSPHFVIYADDAERDIRLFSGQLELYHAAMAVITGMALPPPSPSNRMTVFVVKNTVQVQELLGDDNRNVGGFYLSRAGGSVAIVPQVKVATGEQDWSMSVLLHEYAHHFLMSSSAFPAPRWLNEGSAEFFSAARFSAYGGLAVGLPQNYPPSMYAGVSAEELLDPELYEKRQSGEHDSFYGKSWALFHYLTFNQDRRGQLGAYLRLLAAGKSSREAAVEAFGSFEQLDEDIRDYVREPTLLSIAFEPGKLETGRVDVRTLSEGEVAMMPVRMRSRRGVTREQALEVLGDARAVAVRYPEDAAVLAALAEAEYDAGNDAAAVAAADAALALDATQVNAYVQKGYALFRMAAKADDPEDAYRDAVAPFLALNKLEPDHPLPLFYYYRSFAEREVQPSETAVRGLERAVELAPFDVGLRLALVTQQILDGRLDEARSSLVPVAYSPHPTVMAEGARAVIERIDARAGAGAETLLELLRSPAEAEQEPAGGR